MEVEIEFLTDSPARDKSKNGMIAGIVAQPLSYLTLSLQMTRARAMDIESECKKIITLVMMTV